MGCWLSFAQWGLTPHKRHQAALGALTVTNLIAVEVRDANEINRIYWFQTTIPLSYHVSGFDRAAHIHMKVWDKRNGVLTTEVYFPGE